MKKNVLLLCLVQLLLLAGIPVSNAQRLWYQQPAKEWMQALPLANGRLGIMIFGGIETETIGLNEITMWSGQPDPFQERAVDKDSWKNLRQLFFDGKYLEGNQIGTELLAGLPHSFGSHVPLGDIAITFKHPAGQVKNYVRELDIDQAISKVSYQIGDTKFEREFFASNPADVLVTRLSASKKGALNLVLALDLLRESTLLPTKDGLTFNGTVSFPRQGPGGVNFLGKVSLKLKDGSMQVKDGKVYVEKASTVDIVFDVNTDLLNANYEASTHNNVDHAIAQEYTQLKATHIADYKKLYDRVKLSFGKSGFEHLPTDVRWERLKAGNYDIGMDALFFHYGRYLQIASSRENSPFPTNLQGIWNDNLACNSGWTNDYHLDMNTQMNYWLANVGNLAETNTPLFSYIQDLAKHGAKTAKNVYNSRGWTAHTVANVWGYTASGSGVNWGLFPTASSWIASHLWTQYQYTLDKNFLRQVAYPILKGNAEFFIDYMVKDPKSGYLMTGPSTSPENSFSYQGHDMALSMMPTADRQLVYEAFQSCLEAAETLNLDAAFQDTLRSSLKLLPPMKIGKNGAIQEWFEDFKEAHPNHRHTSHLLGLYPFAQITPDETPELAAAAQKTIEGRLAAEGWEDVEWSRANLISFYARLRNANEAYESVVQLQREFARENLLTISPEGIGGAPSDIFVFDGNQGGGAGIAEMLLQSHNDLIQLLPALPAAWKTGYFTGLCARGGAELDANWVNGKLTSAKVKATVGNTFNLKLPTANQVVTVTVGGKKTKVTTDANGVLKLTLATGEYTSLAF
ncbi:glycoside hydrolase family 95 protein [Sphingobacterium sp. Mn56C]|uniref:glycoside hydrolase family 95 protein n=1 Tax=Sphingobacterium sp. Mn56C TaxID=3395261 RepID=UPI003BCC2CEA